MYLAKWPKTINAALIKGNPFKQLLSKSLHMMHYFTIYDKNVIVSANML